MPPRNNSTRNSPLAAARFASARSVPAISMPMPANAIVPSSSSPTAGTIPTGTSQPSATPTATTSTTCTTSSARTVAVLAIEQSAARQRRRAEPLEHAVAALEAGRDAERHHRRRHDRERQHAGHEEVDRVRVVGRDRVDLGEEHEDAERDRQRDDHVLAPPELQHGLGPRLRDERARVVTSEPPPR